MNSAAAHQCWHILVGWQGEEDWLHHIVIAILLVIQHLRYWIPCRRWQDSRLAMNCGGMFLYVRHFYIFSINSGWRSCLRRSIGHIICLSGRRISGNILADIGTWHCGIEIVTCTMRVVCLFTDNEIMWAPLPEEAHHFVLTCCQ